MQFAEHVNLLIQVIYCEKNAPCKEDYENYLANKEESNHAKKGGKETNKEGLVKFLLR